MSKGGEKILRGLREAVAHASGRATAARMHIVHVPDVKAIRRKLEMSQREFATAYSIPLTTLQGWEQGRRQPDAPAAAYLRAIARLPGPIKSAMAN